MTAPTYAELAAQVAALSEKLSKPLSLDDLPLRDLRSALLDNGEPLDLSILALAGQVADFGGAYPVLRWGQAVVTWPGGTPISGNATPNHNFPTGKLPTDAWVSPVNAATPWCAPQVDIGPALLTIIAHTTDGTNPGAGTTATIHWLAIG